MREGMIGCYVDMTRRNGEISNSPSNQIKPLTCSSSCSPLISPPHHDVGVVSCQPLIDSITSVGGGSDYMILT